MALGIINKVMRNMPILEIFITVRLARLQGFQMVCCCAVQV